MGAPRLYSTYFVIYDLKICPGRDVPSPSQDAVMGLHQTFKLYLQLFYLVARLWVSKSAQLISKGSGVKICFVKQSIGDVVL